MRNLLKGNAAVFAPQMVFAAAMYTLTGDVALAAFAALVVALVVAFVAAYIFVVPAVLTAVGAGVAAVVVGSAADAYAADAVVAAIVVTFVVRAAAREAKRDGAKEPVWILWVAALPLGIGLVGGGIFLLARRAMPSPAL